MRRLMTMFVGVAIVAGSATAAIDSLKVLTAGGTTMYRIAVADIGKLTFDDYNVYFVDKTGNASQRPVGGSGVGLAKFAFSSSAGIIRRSGGNSTSLGSPIVSYRLSGATVSFNLRSKGDLNASVFNSRGMQVRELAASRFNAGSHTLSWNGTSAGGKSVAPGIYHVIFTIDRTPALNTAIVIK